MTLRELLGTIDASITDASITSFAFDTLYRGNVQSIPANLLDTNYREAFHDVYGMDGKEGTLYVRLYL